MTNHHRAGALQNDGKPAGGVIASSPRRQNPVIAGA
jgi:hypothetical protein